MRKSIYLPIMQATALLLPMTACVITPSKKDLGQDAQVVTDACGLLFKYSADQDKELLNEKQGIAKTGCCPEIIKRMDDYHDTRDSIRACQNEKK